MHHVCGMYLVALVDVDYHWRHGNVPRDLECQMNGLRRAGFPRKQPLEPARGEVDHQRAELRGREKVRRRQRGFVPVFTLGSTVE